jgi:hypothetical protein
VIGNALKDVAQMRFRIHVVEFSGADETVHGGGKLATAVGACE